MCGTQWVGTEASRSAYSTAQGLRSKVALGREEKQRLRCCNSTAAGGFVLGMRARFAFQSCDKNTHVCVLSEVCTVVKLQTGAVCIAATTGVLCVLEARRGATGHYSRGVVRHVSLTHVI